MHLQRLHNHSTSAVIQLLLPTQKLAITISVTVLLPTCTWKQLAAIPSTILRVLNLLLLTYPVLMAPKAHAAPNPLPKPEAQPVRGLISATRLHEDGHIDVEVRIDEDAPRQHCTYLTVKIKQNSQAYYMVLGHLVGIHTRVAFTSHEDITEFDEFDFQEPDTHHIAAFAAQHFDHAPAAVPGAGSATLTKTGHIT